MNHAAACRSKIEIMSQLHNLTKEMVDKKDDADFLIASVEKRQDLMTEYDQVVAMKLEDGSDADAIKRLVKDVIKMDQGIAVALTRHRDQSKQELSRSNNQQKVLSYTNQAMSTSGSYMDFRN